MQSFSRRAAAALTLVACTSIAFAQEPTAPVAAAPAIDRSSPEALFRSASDAMKRSDWLAIAQTMEPAALESLKSLMMRLAAADPSGEAASLFLGTSDTQALAALPAAQAFERFMKSATQFVPQLGDMMAGAKTTLLGSVKEGDFLHLVYRTTFAIGEAEAASVEVMTVTKKGDSWYTTLQGDFEPIIQAFVDQVEASAPPPAPEPPAAPEQVP
jgi:hypothetical protein